jgi:hypothetical protein
MKRGEWGIHFFILKTDRFTLDINIKVNVEVEVREKD